MDDQQLTIGEVANRTGVAASALRYWEEVGLIPAPVRISGQRRYPPAVVGLVGVILLLRDVGLSLPETKALLASHADSVEGWRTLAHRKIADLDGQIAKAQTARTAIAHALACPHDDITTCANFARIVAARLAGAPLAEAHPHAGRADLHVVRDPC